MGYDAKYRPALRELEEALPHGSPEYPEMANGSDELVNVLTGVRRLRDAWYRIHGHAQAGEAINDCAGGHEPDWLTRLQKEAAERGEMG